jgi:phospholipase C
MRSLSRRRFLRVVAHTSGALALAPFVAHRKASAGHPAGNPAPASGSLSDIKHVVILMQENRSFDHYFGTLRGVRGFSDTSTIQLAGQNSVFNQPNGDGRQVPFPLRMPSGDPNPEILAQCQGDIAHDWNDQHGAWNGGHMDGWMGTMKKIGALSHLDGVDLPFYHALADAYTICDAYHCSALTGTGPNRTFLWSGSIDAAGHYGSPASTGGDESGLGWRTYAHALEDAGVSWRLYQNSADNFGNNGLAYFSAFTDASADSSLHQRGMADVPKVTGSTPGDILAAIQNDVLNQTLPQVSWIVTDAGTSEHPIGPPVNGENFVYELLAALNAHPGTLDSTALFITYDENGGFFDHVPPPSAPEDTADEFVGGTAVGLGFRVPMLIISPWTRGGFVDSEVFDHTSVIQFLERWTTAIGKPAACTFISDWRRRVCGDLVSAFDFRAPVYGLPELPKPDVSIAVATCKDLPNPEPLSQTLPMQEPGARPARALPYQPNAWLSDLQLDGDGSIRIRITMSNEGKLASKSAHFAVYANAFRSGGPWQYTVPAYDRTRDVPGSVTDFFNVGPTFGDGKYDFTVVGPNRFLRRLTGDVHGAGKGCEIISTFASDPETGNLALQLTMHNASSAKVTFSIRANAYRQRDLVWTYTLAAGESTSELFDQLRYAGGWYDFSASLDVDGSWTRRFVGHIENGAASVSADPESVGGDGNITLDGGTSAEDAGTSGHADDAGMPNADDAGPIAMPPEHADAGAGGSNAADAGEDGTTHGSRHHSGCSVAHDGNENLALPALLAAATALTLRRPR